VAPALEGSGATYAGAGVSLAAADEAVERITSVVASTARPGVLEGIGGFGGLFELDSSRYRRPVLVSSTDGVGTKLVVARDTGRYDTVGIDLVAMCVDDLVCTGAEPLFFLDYVAVGRLIPAQLEQLVAGMAEGCRQAGCAITGGETAEHPGVMAEGEVDLAGFAVGVVEADERLGAHRVVPGDVLVGLASTGLRSNGYSLARRVLLEQAAKPLAGPAWPGAGHSLADELLRPSVIYVPAVRAALAASAGGVHAAAHITGGGIAGNLVRVLPSQCDAVVDGGSWTVPEIFVEIARSGPVDPDEMGRVFNLGLGMIVVVAPDALGDVLAAVAGTGRSAGVVGRIVAGTGQVRVDR
jgi:phosphoribosylformylglycinamidine cyclo-ligase